MEIRLDGEGRLVLPAELLLELGWAAGTALELERVGRELRVRPGPGPATPSAYGAATPAGVDTASLKDEARRLADAMRNVGRPGEFYHGDTETRSATEQGSAAGTAVDTPGPSRFPDPQLPTPQLVPYQDRSPRVPASCYIAPGAFLSGAVTLGEACSVWPGASLRGDVNRIEMGARSNVQDGAVIHVNHGASPTIVGAGVTIGHQATLHGCHVEDDTLVGIHAVVLDGARLGKGCMIGAGAVVPPGMEVPPGKLVLGVPGKIVRDLTAAELEANRANAAEYVRLRGEYLAGQAIRHSGVQAFGAGRDNLNVDAAGPERLIVRTPERATPVYRCRRACSPIVVDGALDEAAWMAAEPVSAFGLADGSGPPRFPTEARLCWDEAHLYVAFSCQDTDIWGTYTQRDEPLFDEEVVEIFLCPSGNLAHYFEIEVSPRGTVFDAKVFNPELDRRTMLVDREWNAAGLQTAVRVAGTLARRDDHDLGWIAELAIPFADLGLAGPPASNEQWRMGLYRIERGEVEEFSAWSPTLKSPPDFHVPARFGTLVFVEE